MKYVEVRELYKNTLNEITNSTDRWLSFLKNASWNFKYNFDDQVLIYAQKPESTAVAEMKEWNNKVIPRRWVNKNTKAITIYAKEGSTLPLRFVFDVSDTHNYKNTTYKLWAIKPEYENAIIEELDASFGNVNNKESLVQGIYNATYNAVTDNIQDYMELIEKYKIGTSLENLEYKDIQLILLTTVWASVLYMTFNRCGIDVAEHTDKSNFAYLNYFKDSKLTTILGTATSDIAEMVLREIAKTVRNLQLEEITKNRTFETKQNKEYSNNKDREIKGGKNYEQNRIQETRGLSNSEYIDEGRQNTDREIRNNEKEISNGISQSRIYDNEERANVRKTFDGNSETSNENGKNDSREISQTRRDNRKIESTRPNEMDTIDEQLQIDSGRTSDERTNIQLNLLTEEEQKQNIAEAETVSAFSFTQEMIDETLEENKIIPKIKGQRRNKIEYFDLYPQIPIEKRNNYKITNEQLGEGTPREKYQRNIEAIKVLKKCETENRYATLEEQEILAQYIGWGGLQEVFDSRNDSWKKEYEELKSLLTEKEYEEAKESTLTAFYTPPIVINAIYKVLEKMGLQRGNILEPSCRNR